MKNTEFCLRQSALRRALRVRDHDQCSTQTFISLQKGRFLRQQRDKEQPCKNSLNFLLPWKMLNVNLLHTTLRMLQHLVAQGRLNALLLSLASGNLIRFTSQYILIAYLLVSRGLDEKNDDEWEKMKGNDFLGLSYL